MDYTVLFYFQSRLKCQSHLCTFYFFALIFDNIHFRRLFPEGYHFKRGIGEDMALVHLLKELCETPSALLILRAIIMQGKRQHVLVLPERTSITVARISPSTQTWSQSTPCKTPTSFTEHKLKPTSDAKISSKDWTSKGRCYLPSETPPSQKGITLYCSEDPVLHMSKLLLIIIVENAQILL